MADLLISQRQEARQEAKIHTLNLYMIRDYHSLLDHHAFINDEDYIRYFKLIREYMPGQADGYGLLGYCYARQHHLQEAIKNEEIALGINPNFFWNYYNLGLLLWANGDAAHASMIFQKSISLSPKETLSSISSSKVYMDILNGAGANYDAVESLKQGYQRTVFFLKMLASGSPAPEIASNVQAL